MVKLIIEDDEGKTTVVPLIRDEITIGRKEGNTIRLTERNVSRRHAKLTKQNGAIFIEDLASYNGIKINGNKVSGRVAVTEGDRIQIGDYVLGLKLEAGVAAAEDPFAAAQTVEMSNVHDLPTAQIDVSDAQAAVATVEGGLPAQEGEHVAPEPKPRLVCVSANFAGEDWELSKAVMVIGRTDDNDVVINHRSISRHHSRITCENGRYTILDLQSANGVRINGEEYGKVELRQGDLVDLGHVRLRFVGASEDFVFERDAEVVDISKPASSKGLLWAVLSGIAVVVIAMVVWRFSGSTENPQPEIPKNTPPPATSGLPDSTAKTQTPPPASDSEDTALVLKITSAVDAEQWQDALNKCAKLSPEGKVKAKSGCDEAKLERDAKESFEKFDKAATLNNRLEALRAHGKIPADSVYKKKGLDKYKDVKSNFLKGAYTDLDEAVVKKDCARAKTMADQIKEVDPDDTNAVAKAKKCGETVVAVRPPPKRPPIRKPRPPRVPPKKKVQPPRVPPKVPPKKSGPTMADLQKANELIKKASARYIAADYKSAIKQARAALKFAPGNAMAIQIVGASACLLKKMSSIKWAYKRLPPKKRQLLRQVCQRNGVQID